MRLLLLIFIHRTVIGSIARNSAITRNPTCLPFPNVSPIAISMVLASRCSAASRTLVSPSNELAVCRVKNLATQTSIVD